MQYFNKFICFLTFGILSLLYQLTKNKHNMKHLDNFLFIYSLALFVIILSNMARLVSDYLITKIK